MTVSNLVEELLAPTFLNKPPAYFKFTEGDSFNYSLGQISGPDSDEVEVNAELGDTSAFLRFDVDALTLSVFEGASERGTYIARITLSHEYEFGL